ncbi:MAG: hypothetical protein HQ553_10280 [Chloroflexi bacterium]|nr:hypothetical protein [Chloroflexota bacterium]
MIVRKLTPLFTRGLQADIERRTAGQDVIMQTGNANSFGQSSRGIKQIRGNGALILTRQEIQFLMTVPRSEITIPLGQVTSVSLPKSHLGKTVFKPLLRVEYQSLEGPDSIAWAIQNPEKWKSAIENAHKKS